MRSMKRRRFVQAMVAAPAAAPALVAQQQQEPPLPELKFAVADAAAETVRRFFDARQFATLRRLSQMLEPAVGHGPGAVECGTPEFLDFLLSASPRQRQQLYLSGLDALEYESRARFGRSFADTSDAEAAELLAPLRRPWTYVGPDALIAFLREAKEDVRNATRNSETWAKAGLPGGGGQYWLPVE
jgi:hypothetical protein